MEKGRHMAGSLPFLPQKRADIPHYAAQVPDLNSDADFTPPSMGLTSGDVTDL
jgi:hypothetical protein